MTTFEGERQLLIGKLVVEQSELEKRIGKLRDETERRATIFARIGRLLVLQPERVVFEGQIVDEHFTGEPAIDRKAMDVDRLIADLRAAIVRKRECMVQLAEMGIDLEEAEREKNLRASRALFHPSNVRYEPDDGVTQKAKRGGLGFARPREKSEV
jgi:hypothetical protein